MKTGGGASYRNAEEVMDGAKVFHSKFITEGLDNGP
jgi:hypothetical protein